MATTRPEGPLPGEPAVRGDAAAAAVLAGLAEVVGWQEDAYRAVHQHPELPDAEARTAAMAAGAAGCRRRR